MPGCDLISFVSCLQIDPNEAYYFNRFHDFPDGYDGKDVRNLDGIGE